MKIELPEPVCYGIFADGICEQTYSDQHKAEHLRAYTAGEYATVEPLYTESKLKQAMRDVLEDAATEFEHMGGFKDGYSCASRLRKLKEQLK